MVDRFRIFCKRSVTGQMLPYPQIINPLSRTTLTIFVSSSFLLSYIAKEVVAFLLKYRKLGLYLRYVIKIHSVFHSYSQISTGKYICLWFYYEFYKKITMLLLNNIVMWMATALLGNGPVNTSRPSTRTHQLRMLLLVAREKSER
jgi:hypothetical protein